MQIDCYTRFLDNVRLIRELFAQDVVNRDAITRVPSGQLTRKMALCSIRPRDNLGEIQTWIMNPVTKGHRYCLSQTRNLTLMSI